MLRYMKEISYFAFRIKSLSPSWHHIRVIGRYADDDINTFLFQIIHWLYKTWHMLLNKQKTCFQLDENYIQIIWTHSYSSSSSSAFFFFLLLFLLLPYRFSYFFLLCLLTSDFFCKRCWSRTGSERDSWSPLTAKVLHLISKTIVFNFACDAKPKPWCWPNRTSVLPTTTLSCLPHLPTQ